MKSNIPTSTLINTRIRYSLTSDKGVQVKARGLKIIAISLKEFWWWH